MNMITQDRITEGMTVATIPSTRSGLRARIVGEVESVDRYTIGGREFADIRLTSGTTLTNMSGEYELVNDRC